LERVFLRSGLVVFGIGVTLLAAFAFRGSQVDALGVLREPFYLLGIGAPMTVLGLVLLLAVLGTRFAKRFLEKN
jgi:hypothetical protein